MVISGRDGVDVRRAGRAAFAGFELRALARVPSTQDAVRAAARAGASPGFCCTADEQSVGRGRQGRSWSAPAGSALLCSILVRVANGVVSGLPLAAGLAVRDALLSSVGVEAWLKWPNDVVVGGRKLAGILCEVEPLAPGPGVAVVVGVGINLARPAAAAHANATSIEELSGVAPAAATVLAALLTALPAPLATLGSAGVSGLRNDWMLHAWGMGVEVLARSPQRDVRGVAEGIDDDGALLVRVGRELTRVLAADVHLTAAPRGPGGALR